MGLLLDQNAFLHSHCAHSDKPCGYNPSTDPLGRRTPLALVQKFHLVTDKTKGHRKN